MWQSRIETEYCSVTYFERITEFDVLLHLASTRGGADTHFVSALDIHTFT